jgi:hypothetical protein
MITNVLNRQVSVQEATVTVGATGMSNSWGASVSHYCRRISLDVRTVAGYQKLGTVVSHRFIFRGKVDIRIGYHRILDGSTYYEPSSSGQYILDSDVTIVLVRES